MANDTSWVSGHNEGAKPDLRPVGRWEPWMEFIPTPAEREWVLAKLRKAQHALQVALLVAFVVAGVGTLLYKVATHWGFCLIVVAVLGLTAFAFKRVQSWV